MLPKKLPTFALLVAAWCWTSEANTYFDVACSGVNSELKCPDGELIEVLAMDTGSVLNAKCDARNQQASIYGTACLHPLMLGWVKSVCDNLERCRLPKPNIQMFTCPLLFEPFIQLTYKCKAKNPEMKEAVACENDVAKLQCEKGVIAILEAKYGRLDEVTCINGTSSMTFCSSPLAKKVVQESCALENKCEVEVSSENLGIPIHCDMLAKYLYVSYICI
uniref:rhamnose-binding lectin-like n=1 Tax=Scatophagus argus TaxID=75038 RepID=UPI001ED80F63|nr:rhamnose-binding lectin-like [Scatophagus argus]